MVSSVPCSIAGCGKAVAARGWCSAHYTRWQRHGDPNVTTRQPPRTGEEKRCPRCANTKPLTEFGERPSGKPKGYCRSCEASYQVQYAAGPDGRERKRQARSRWNASNHEYFLLYRYGLTLDDYNALLQSQGGRCAICGTSEPGGGDLVWHVDHCHETNRVRGLLCGLCNRGLGQFRDDIGRLRAAADYLQRTAQ